ncbi:hypothetical protein HJ01_00338 [Flavobacterium frigoris PS1]|uniref:Uncharacterized protein n=1 Tax=Flavobacterium frigoris (strain PS1) TaxID=1086011 RepID=H7FMN1_FLAFP|nr:hypothetical protein HJ01_00338 [Flavobacterium frigoris PS1]
MDTPTHGALTEALELVRVVEKGIGLKIACLEKVAFKMKYIDKGQLIEIAS